MKKQYTISEISKVYHIGLDSIRYYEEIGLISPRRGNNNYRYYDKTDISKLNIIRELLDLGFTTKEIAKYFEEHNINSTYKLLKEEKNRINKAMQKLKEQKANVESRLKEIKEIQNVEFETVKIKKMNKRKYFIINVGSIDDDEVDFLIQKMAHRQKDNFYIIGNNEIGTIISKNTLLAKNELFYESVFSFDKKGDKTLDEGNYLSILYSGDYKKTLACSKILIDYANKNNLEICSNFFEIIWIDNHSTDDPKEYVTEIQVKVKDKN